MTHIERPFDIARLEDEWLEADGFGGFASGTVGTLRTRRYHALLLAATRAPGGRMVLVNGIEAWLEVGGERIGLSAQRYLPDVIYPDLSASLAAFDTSPWPSWRFEFGAQSAVIAEVFVSKATCETVLRWRLERAVQTPQVTDVTDVTEAERLRDPVLKVRPLLSGRDYHALHHENAAFDFAAQVSDDRACASWQPYSDVPAIHAASNGVYTHAPDWYRDFCYTREQERGLDFSEDLATPGVFSFTLATANAVMILSASSALQCPDAQAAENRAAELALLEQQRRDALGSRLHRSADAYIVTRNEGRTILAGFPWFTDWGRDTFIAMRGLLIASQRLDEAEAILLEWSGTLSEGMLPNRFPDYGDTPEYNSVDASLWFIVAVHDYLATGHASAATRARLQQAAEAILGGYTRGTRFQIHACDDGLLAAGVPGVQLTWMDAKVGDWVVTPRIGKPVEVQALWINALRIAASWNPQWQAAADRALQAFHERFIDPSTHTLADNVDVDHVPGAVDRSIRPNQIFALGGLPFALLDGAAARAVLAQVEAHLLTPLGLRTLAPSDPSYRGKYDGPPLARDGAYHQGTVWPWLLGPFVDAWLRVHGTAARTGGQVGEQNGEQHGEQLGEQHSEQIRTQIRTRFLTSLYAQLDHTGLDHLCEIADGDPPHAPRGTPFQAWSLGELLRIETLLARLGDSAA